MARAKELQRSFQNFLLHRSSALLPRSTESPGCSPRGRSTVGSPARRGWQPPAGKSGLWPRSLLSRRWPRLSAIDLFSAPSAARCRSTPDPAPQTDAIELMPKIFAKDVVFGIGRRICPDRSQTSDQPGNPVCCLDCLIAVAFQVERHLD